MPKETLEEVNNKTGLGNILQSVYKYLRDNNILLGTWKNPIFNTRKARIPIVFYAKHNILGSSGFATTKPFFSFKNNHADKSIRLMTFVPTVKANKIVEWDIYKNPTLTGASWVAFNGAADIQKDTTATALSGGTLIGGLDMPSTDGKYISIGDEPVIFECLPGETITIAAKADSSATDLYLRIRIEEVDI